MDGAGLMKVLCPTCSKKVNFFRACLPAYNGRDQACSEHIQILHIMNKQKFVKEVAHRTGMTEVSVRKLMKTMEELLIERMAKDDIVSFQYFGKFIPHMQKRRTNARDPRTGRICVSAAKLTFKFRPSHYALGKLNGFKANEDVKPLDGIVKSFSLEDSPGNSFLSIDSDKNINT